MTKFLRLDTEIFNISEILNLKYELCEYSDNETISVCRKKTHPYHNDQTNYYYADSKEKCLEFLKLFTDFLSNSESFLDGSPYFSVENKKSMPGSI